MAIDMRRLATLVRKDRGARSQSEYAAEVGLTQSQVSKLETGAMRTLTYEVGRALERKLGKLPEETVEKERPKRHAARG